MQTIILIISFFRRQLFLFIFRELKDAVTRNGHPYCMKLI